MWFKFNGISSKEFPDLVVKKLPTISSTPNLLEEISIEGKGSAFRIKGKKLRNKTIECYLRTNVNIDAIIEWLGTDQEVTMVTSDEPDKTYYVRVNEEIAFSKASRLRVFSIPLTIMPYKYDADTKIEFQDGQEFTVDNNNSLSCYPYILLSNPSSQISISLDGEEICSVGPIEEGVDTSIHIDCQRYKVYNNRNVMYNVKMKGDFFSLEKGEHIITISGSAGTFFPMFRWR